MSGARWMLVGAGLWIAAASACDKVPLVDIDARFTLADATWFADEQTLFVFYRVDAEQGLGPNTQLELAWRTDDFEQPFTPLAQLTPVHTHLPVECGTTARCGSISVHVASVPRSVALRMRYHSEGEVTLDPSETAFHVVGPGPAHTNRSLIVYGVFDEQNLHVQWRARHQFPALRNEEAQALGLRRYFSVADPAHGEVGPLPEDNPYGYGMDAACPAALAPLGWPPVETTDRAVFDLNELPFAASASPAVCGRSTVTDATGTFETVALARKNPEVRPAFSALHSPVRDNTPIGFVLRPCRRTISQEHLDMQLQRLLLSGAPEICIDDWTAPDFAAQLATRFRASFDLVRPQGNDMVLVIALHHDDRSGQIAALVEQALQQVLPPERDKTSPRVSGAFVFDSLAHSLGTAELRRLVLWCPANIAIDDLEQIPAASERSCPIRPDIPDLELGPFKFNTLPILPTRPQYTTFIEKYSEAQAGRMKSLRFRSPERTPLSENILLGDFAVATFFNNEVLTPEADDKFSYCEPPQTDLIVFRVAITPEPGPLAVLPEVHATFPQPSYWLGLLWEFQFLTRLEYEVTLAGAAGAYGLSVPFGISNTEQSYYGTEQWLTGEFPIADRLLQCTRFCDHPTFDSATTYNVGAPFEPTYRNQCYRPSYPAVGDGGFPRDP